MALRFLNSGYFAGKVGIGTASPDGLLHVSSGTSGDALVIIESDTDNNDENDNPQLQFKQDGGNTIAKIGLSGDAGTIFTNSLANTAYFGNDEAASVQLYTNATARLTIESGGDVGIGTTNPTRKLNVNGNVGINNQLLLDSANYGEHLAIRRGIYGYDTIITGTRVDYSPTADTNTFKFLADLQTTGQLNVTGNAVVNGNVGIGTTLPDFKLDVDGTFGVSDLPFNTDSVSVLVADETLGADTIINGDFATATDWTLGTGWSIANGKLTANNPTSYAQQGGVFASGVSNTYKISLTVSNYVSGYFTILTGGSTAESQQFSANGNYTITFNTNSPSSTTFHFTPFGSFNGSIENVSVQLITSASNQIQKRELGAGAFGPTPVGAYLPLAGGTITGNLTVNGTTSIGNQLTFPYGSMGDYIYHTGDGNTFFGFNSSDQWKVTAGGNVGIQLQNAGVYLYYGGNEKIRTTSGGVTITGDIKIQAALLSNQDNTDVDTGTETVANVAIATYTAAFFDFVIKKGTNVRSGTVYACHDGTNVEFTETSTQDLGNTSDVTLSVDISGTNMRLRATSLSESWSVKSLIRAI
jgi:hypothetical protein